MEHKTIVSFLICFTDSVTESNSSEHLSAIEKLKKLKQFVIEKDENYSFEVLRDGIVYTVNNGLEKEFDDFINHIQNGVKWDEELEESFLTAGAYEGEGVDLEEGEIYFEESFVINEGATVVYLNTPIWYASELERLHSDFFIGIDCEMNDVDGDYYYFTI